MHNHIMHNTYIFIISLIEVCKFERQYLNQHCTQATQLSSRFMNLLILLLKAFV